MYLNLINKYKIKTLDWYANKRKIRGKTERKKIINNFPTSIMAAQVLFPSICSTNFEKRLILLLSLYLNLLWYSKKSKSLLYSFLQGKVKLFLPFLRKSIYHFFHKLQICSKRTWKIIWIKDNSCDLLLFCILKRKFQSAHTKFIYIYIYIYIHTHTHLFVRKEARSRERIVQTFTLWEKEKYLFR